MKPPIRQLLIPRLESRPRDLFRFACGQPEALIIGVVIVIVTVISIVIVIVSKIFVDIGIVAVIVTVGSQRR